MATGGIAEDVINDLKKKGKCPPGEKMIGKECHEIMEELPMAKPSKRSPMKEIPPGKPGNPKMKEL